MFYELYKIQNKWIKYYDYKKNEDLAVHRNKKFFI